MDEPTAGLDPEERVRFRNLLSDLSGDRIVILSTHIVSDVEATASAIALIDKGRLLAHAAPEELLQTVAGRVWEWTVPSVELQTIRQKHLVSSTMRTDDGVRLRIVSEKAPYLDAHNAPPTLEDAYLYIIEQHRNGSSQPAHRANLPF